MNNESSLGEFEVQSAREFIDQVNNSPLQVVGVSETGLVLAQSESAKRLIQPSSEEWLGDCLDVNDRARFGMIFERFMRGEQVEDFSVEVGDENAENGTGIHLGFHLVWDKRGYVVVQVHDNTDFVEERRKLLSAAETKALTDELTKLPNRRSFNEKIAEELERFNRYGTVFSLIMLDIDEFKAVNDAFGHGSGDQVLIALARKMKESVRALDLVSRIGGEEFTILLAETGIDGAKQRAELLREMVEDMVVKTDQGDIDITISLGVVSVRDGDTAKSMLYDVDSAMYQAKQGGRNQAVVLW